ncbi:MAG: PP2C family protein-serine/threonine phosphatase [Bacteroidia bacterium]
MAVSYRSTLIYFSLGALWGCVFPVGAFLLEAWHRDMPLTLSTWETLHQESIFLYIIDTAPLSLGIAYALVGRYRDRTNATIAERTQELRKVNEELLVYAQNISSVTDELDRLYRELQESIDAAQRIQEGVLLESRKAFFEGYVAAVYQRDKVGGDFYYVARYPRVPSVVAFVLVDCMGHGPAAALATIATYSALRSVLEREEKIAPGHLLYQLHQKLLEFPDAIGSVDVSLALYDTQTDIVSLAAAKHAIYILGSEGVEEFGGTRFSVGHWHARAEVKPEDFVERSFVKGSKKVLLCSDGWTTQRQKETLKKLGRKNWLDFLEAHRHLPPKELIEAAENFLLEYRAGAPQDDDLSILVF